MRKTTLPVILALLAATSTATPGISQAGVADRAKPSFGDSPSAYTSKPSGKCVFSLTTKGLDGARIKLSFAQADLTPPWEEVDVNALTWKRVKTVRGRNGEVSATIVARKDGYWRFSVGRVVSEPWYLDVWPTSDLIGDDGPYDLSCPTR